MGSAIASIFKLITFHNELKYEFEAETFDEILSLTVDAFNQNHELIEISKNKEVLYMFCQIYKLINKTTY